MPSPHMFKHLFVVFHSRSLYFWEIIDPMPSYLSSVIRQIHAHLGTTVMLSLKFVSIFKLATDVTVKVIILYKMGNAFVSAYRFFCIFL